VNCQCQSGGGRRFDGGPAGKDVERVGCGRLPPALTCDAGRRHCNCRRRGCKAGLRQSVVTSVIRLSGAGRWGLEDVASMRRWPCKWSPASAHRCRDGKEQPQLSGGGPFRPAALQHCNPLAFDRARSHILALSVSVPENAISALKCCHHGSHLVLADLCASSRSSRPLQRG